MSNFQTEAQNFICWNKHRVKPSTSRCEMSIISRILDFGDFAEKDIACIKPLDVENYQNKRTGMGIAASTINGEVAIMSKVFIYAIKREACKVNPCDAVSKLKVKKPERRFLTADEIDRLCEFSTTQSFKQYLRFLQYTGAREKEAIRVRWTDVDFKNRRVCIGADGESKNGKSRWVDFSESLRVLLEQMGCRCSMGLLFGDETSFRTHLNFARSRSNLNWVGFHDFRRHFVSQCVMAGIDFATIARWAGHSDGGALLAKKYAFLANDHAAKQAAKLKF